MFYSLLKSASFLSDSRQIGYTGISIGSECKRVTSKAECEEAAIQLGLSDLEASEETAPDWPPYCYFYQMKTLYFNNDGYAISECDDYSKVCICKKGKMTSQ